VITPVEVVKQASSDRVREERVWYLAELVGGPLGMKGVPQ